MEILREPAFIGDERDTFIGSLERGRRLVAWKTRGLDAEGMRATLAPSTLTLGGLLTHLATVEDDMFQVRLGEPAAVSVADKWSPEGGVELWEAAVARSRANLARFDLGDIAPWTSSKGLKVSVRRLVADMIEEYARHLGHIDLIRESIDGLVGEDEPDE
ncbi:mini-circle protein [Actinorhabdospora filicis]|uniref:Mini-circle protein n=1 Tax=Actinorhabdospora filicis TaxID=1785913 RepID=A0A9W6SH15_9ACTN|nr:DUF664 domain-containing protein [Actinorhabdospora filicis]GLZ76990.1 mini-circle protein [Actinorhabdospora filicis]